MRLRVATVLAVLALSSSCFAGEARAGQGESSLEATLNYGTEAFNDLDGQFGVSAGYGYRWSNDLQARVDLSYYRSSANRSDMDLTGTRVPLDLGVRYYLPLHRVDPQLSAFGQGGLEISFDNWKPGPETPSRNNTALGVLVGAGAQYELDAHYSAVAHLQYHIIEKSFLSAGIGLAYRY